MKNTKEEIIKQLETIVFEALGTASMCWSETPKGVFDSSQASDVGNEAVSLIMKLYTDQIKSMENYIRDVDGQVKELREENESLKSISIDSSTERAKNEIILFLQNEGF